MPKPIHAERAIIKFVKQGRLSIDEHGNIWRIYKSKSIRAEKIATNGYLMIRITENRKTHYGMAHRLVYQHFNGDIPDGYTINHTNGNRRDNNPNNLEPMTYRQNVRHAIESGLINQWGESNASHKISNKQVNRIRILFKSGKYNQKQLARKYKISTAQVSRIIRGTRRAQQDGPTSQNNKIRDPITGRFKGIHD